MTIVPRWYNRKLMKCIIEKNFAIAIRVILRNVTYWEGANIDCSITNILTLCIGNH